MQTAVETNEEQFAALIGVDWGNDEHAWTLAAADRGKRERGKLRQTPEAIETWVAGLIQRFPGKRIAIGVEQKRGALIYALSKYPQLLLFPIPPLMSSRYRAAIHTSGSKSDPVDADLLLDLVTLHRDKLSPLQPDSEAIRKLQLFVEHRRGLVDHRTACTNQIRSHLKMYFPQALDWFEELDAPILAAFLARWPTVPKAQTASAGQLREFFHQQHSRSENLIEKRVTEIGQATPLTTDPAVVEPLSMLVQALLQVVAALRLAITTHESAIEVAAPVNPDYAIFASFPGAGDNLAPRLLAAFGSRRDRWETAADIATFSGIAPVMIASGKSRRVSFRWACPKFLRQTFHEYAACSIQQCDWAKAFYDKQRAKGNKHPAAVRSLAFKWIRIQHACWKSNTPYCDTHYQNALAVRLPHPADPPSSPLPPPAQKSGAVKILFKTENGFSKFSGLGD